MCGYDCGYVGGDGRRGCNVRSCLCSGGLRGATGRVCSALPQLGSRALLRASRHRTTQEGGGCLWGGGEGPVNQVATRPRDLLWLLLVSH